MKVAIHGKPFLETSKTVIQQVFDKIKDKNIDLIVSDVFAELLNHSGVTTQPFSTYNEKIDDQGVDFLFTLGGDGTLLEAITHVGNLEVPILGINTGRLGFLATTSRDELINAIEAVFDKNYSIDNRTLLKLESETELFQKASYALNDFAILKKDTSAMIVVHAYIDGDFLNSYWADGIIVSTPTGSTGYSLSCGGPIVLSKSGDFIITPVSPHNLTVRPLVVPDSSKLTFKIEGRNNNFLISLDSRYRTVEEDVELSISKENFKVKLIKLKDYNFFDTLRQKLNWGLDVRN